MKTSRKTSKDNAYPAVKEWSLKLLSTMVLGCLATSAGHTSDLEIYQGATYGNATIMMMLDNSGSMDTRSIREDYPNVNFRYSGNENLTERIYNDEGKQAVDSITYRVDYYTDSSGNKYYDRMSRLKMALIPMFANPKSDQAFGKDVDLNKYRIGLGSFFFRSTNEGGGKIESPVVNLTLANRKALINKIVGLQAETNTPIANAYAEAGAYMLGTNTTRSVYETRYVEVGVLTRDDDEYSLYQCRDTSSELEIISGAKVYSCNSGRYIQRQDDVKFNRINLSLIGNYDESYDRNGRRYYYKKVTKDWADEKWSGFALSADETKKRPDKTNYQSPIVDEVTQCDGYGVYFLTDGEPNNAYSSTKDLMNRSLVGGSTDMGSSCNSNLADTGSTSGWECIGEYSKALYNKNNAKSVPIATATVGFGSVYKELAKQGKVARTITRPSGAVETVQVYQCDHPNVTSRDAQNLCKLGEKGNGYGEGGFYFTEDSADIASSVRKFIEDVSKAEIDPISAGTMSVPLDSLGGLKSRQYAYLPILEPVPKSPLLWNGNLKKYKVRNATLVGSNNNFVFSDNTGLFARNTYDEWNTINDDSRPDTLKADRGGPQVGGTYQKVFENAVAPLIGDRNLFVDNGGSLTNLKVTANKPVNFTTLAGYTNPQKLTLLSFMGYSEPTTTTVKDGTALTSSQDKGLKNIGGVLHSIPQLITQKVKVDASGQFDTSTRKDYLIYGSMDGALHMVDDSTGKETFTFVPKQILDLQPDALKGKGGSSKDGSYPYGVDAPWLTYVSYTTKSTTTGTGAAATTTNTYESDQSFALGGLRMGGSMYYALDVSDVYKPKIIYGIGSNYANRLKGDTAALGGTKNNTTGLATDEQKAFAKMGQSWGKPTLGYVKSGGKKVMVSFLPGGYDTCYEDPKFKLNTSYPTNTQCTNKTAAQGSSVYMVQMGEVKTKTNKEETVDTSKNNGKLLWWANNQGSGSDSTSRSSSLQYSKSSDLKHSVVTQIRASDRNYDGLIDHIYFADLGGQVWRVDINNNEDTDNFKIDRVVKVLDVSNQASAGDAPPRFYERPLLTFYNGKYAYKDASADAVVGNYSGVQAMITVGTGDRSNPVEAVRNTPDALYSIVDKDLTRTDLFDYDSDAVSDISLRTPTIKVAGTTNRNDKLQKLTFTSSDIGTTGIKRNMENNVVQGWYMPFTHWLGADAGVAGKYKIKMFNEPDAIAGILLSSSYNPDVGQEIKACSAGVRGETQRERTCLPYGVCLDGAGNEDGSVYSNGSGGAGGSGSTGGAGGGSTNDSNGARAFVNAGSGIVDNIVSQYNDTSVFTSLVNRCEGDDCKPSLICPDGNCGNDGDPIFDECAGASCGIDSGINTDKRINPLSWVEH
ncbi:hypothetical protein [uncultured Psychrobacter sp.]|uniref:hypothetical protein n=1 Tax=uncultured Psychrobacter sp. TaxID=259303 RepID=UPI00345A8CCE